MPTSLAFHHTLFFLLMRFFLGIIHTTIIVKYQCRVIYSPPFNNFVDIGLYPYICRHFPSSLARKRLSHDPLWSRYCHPLSTPTPFPPHLESPPNQFLLVYTVQRLEQNKHNKYFKAPIFVKSCLQQTYTQTNIRILK